MLFVGWKNKGIQHFAAGYRGVVTEVGVNETGAVL
jgi:hypothetical protein